MFSGGQRGNGFAREVGAGLGEVVDQDAAAGEEACYALAEGGGIAAPPGGDGDAGLLGDVGLVDHWPVAGDHCAGSLSCCGVAGEAL